MRGVLYLPALALRWPHCCLAHAAGIIFYTTMSESTSTAPFEALTFEQLRVLGCLMEKEATTPDYYPLTLNALVTACNQSTNREPVVSFDERTVMVALEGLKLRQFVFQLTQAGARVQKFKHNLEAKLPALEKPEAALLCVLLLRGPQTIGELRQRSERLHSFADLEAVETAVRALMEAQDGTLVVTFPPGPGRKSLLYMHTLGGMPDTPATGGTTSSFEPSLALPRTEEDHWRANVEAQLAQLRAELAELKAQLGA